MEAAEMTWVLRGFLFEDWNSAKAAFESAVETCIGGASTEIPSRNLTSALPVDTVPCLPFWAKADSATQAVMVTVKQKCFSMMAFFKVNWMVDDENREFSTSWE